MQKKVGFGKKSEVWNGQSLIVHLIMQIILQIQNFTLYQTYSNIF